MHLQKLFSNLVTTWSFSTEVWLSLILGAFVTLIIAYIIYRVQKKEANAHKQDHDAKLAEIKELHQQDSEKIKVLYELILKSQSGNVGFIQQEQLEDKIQVEAAKITENDSLQARTLKAIAENEDDEAERLLKEIEARKHDLVEVYKLRALKDFRAGNLEKAETAYLKLMELESESDEYLNIYTTLLMVSSKLDEAEQMIDSRLSQDKGEQDGNNNKTAFLYRGKGKIGFLKGHYKEAETFFLKSLEFIGEESDSSDDFLFQLYVDMGRNYNECQKYTEAESYLKKSLEIISAKGESKEEERSVVLSALSLIYSNQGKHEEAVKLVLESMNLAKKYLSGDHFSIGTCYGNLASIYLKKGDFADAEENFRKAYDILSRKVGIENQQTLIVKANMAFCQARQHNHEDAIKTYNELIPLIEKQLGPDSGFLIVILENLASSLAEAGELEKAETTCNRAINIAKNELGEDNPGMFRILNKLAFVYAKQKKFDLALETSTKVYETCLKSRGEYDTSTLGQIREMTRILMTSERYEEAEKHFSYLLPTYQSNPTFAPYYTSFIEDYRNVLEKLGRHEEAEQLS